MTKCLKGESEVKKKQAKFACGKCGALSNAKDHLCKPEKLPKDQAEKPAKKKK